MSGFQRLVGGASGVAALVVCLLAVAPTAAFADAAVVCIAGINDLDACESTVGDPCSGTCLGGTCFPGSAGLGASCGSGDLCSFGETCDPFGDCTGTPTSCADDGTACTVEACDPATGFCETSDAPVGTPCESDGNDCTDDLCTGTGTCSQFFNTSSCDDGDACTTGDVCDGGGSCAGSAFDCSGSDGECFTASCDPGGSEGNCDTQTPANEGAACDDGAACNTGETCQAGSCTGGSAVSCDGLDTFCADVSCDPAGAEGNCDTEVAQNDGLACDDGDACIVGEQCSAGACTGGLPPDCSLLDTFCVDVACDPAGGEGNCASLTAVNEGVACDDGAACNVGETCQAGTCSGGAPKNCDDKDEFCVDVFCDDGGAEGNCDGETDINEGVACDDGDACNTGETCQTGSCTGGAAVNCDGDDTFCLDAECDAGGPEGNCDALTDLNEGVACDDGDVCNVGETCQAGACTGGAPVDCSGLGDDCLGLVCDDGGAEGNCDIPVPINEGGSCDDGDPCIVGETCSSGSCGGGSAPDCTAFDGICHTAVCDGGGAEGNCDVIDEASHDGLPCDEGDPCFESTVCFMGECGWVNGADGDPCPDGDLCNGDELCGDDPLGGARHVCLPSASDRDCDDANACTMDFCDEGEVGHDPLTGCNNPDVTATMCADGSDCSMDLCQEDIGCYWLPMSPGTPCDDGHDCTTDTTCNTLFGCSTAAPGDLDHLACDDSDPCTRDVCVAGQGCVHVTPDQDNDGTPDDCDQCPGGDDTDADNDGVADCVDICPGFDDLIDSDLDGTPDGCDDCTGLNVGASCDDGDICTTDDECNSLGQCDGALLDCNDDNSCTADVCIPVWACVNFPNPVAGACDDGDACTTGDWCMGGGCRGQGAVSCDDGDACTADSCDPLDGDGDPCSSDDIGCDDGDPCTADSCDPASGCVNETADCDDGDPCTDDFCDAAGDCQNRPNDGAHVIAGPPAITQPLGVAIAPDGRAFVSDFWDGTVKIVDPTSGTVEGICIGPGPNAPAEPGGLAIGPHDGLLYVTDVADGRVLRYDPTTCSFFDVFIDVGLLEVPWSVAVDHGGSVFVTSADTGEVWAFAPSGAPLGPVVGAGDGLSPSGLAIDPLSGELFIVSLDGQVVRFDGGTIHPVGVTDGDGAFLAFSPAGDLFVSDFVSQAVVRMDPVSGLITGTVVAGPTLFVDGGPLSLAFEADGSLVGTAATGFAGVVFRWREGIVLCDDEDPCTTFSVCDDGSCVGSADVDCSAEDGECVQGVCDPTDGSCTTEARADFTDCDDGDPCTVLDHCTGGVCGGPFVDCGSGDPCLAAFCDPAGADGNCDGSAPANDGGACDDGDACTVDDECASGVCGGALVFCLDDDGNPCTQPDCDANGAEGNCDASLPANDGGACDDGAACTVDDECSAGQCAGQPVVCMDDNCNDRECDPSGAEGNCDLRDRFTGPSCGDGDPCTVGDTCDDGNCSGAPVDCTSLDGDCVAFACNGGGAEGNCDDSTQAGDGTPCDDGDPCTTGDQCSGGVCVGTAVSCTAFDNACETASCDPLGAVGNCAARTAVNEGGPCNDGLACTVGDTCASGRCQSGPAPTCGDPLDTCTVSACDPAGAEGNCDDTTVAPDGDPCDDGDVCNGPDECDQGACGSVGPALVCDAHGDDPCTTDTCDPVQGCGVEVTDCDDGNECTRDECHPTEGCVAVPLGETTIFVPGSDNGGLIAPFGLAFGADGHLYAASFAADAGLPANTPGTQKGGIARYHGPTGLFMDFFVPPGAGLTQPTGLQFGPDGHLYATSFNGHAVWRFDAATGAPLDVADGGFVPPSSNLLEPYDLAFHPTTGDLFVASRATNSVERFDGVTGAPLGSWVSGIRKPLGITFLPVPGPAHDLLVSIQGENFGEGSVLAYTGDGAGPGAPLSIPLLANGAESARFPPRGLTLPVYLRHRPADDTVLVGAGFLDNVLAFDPAGTFVEEVVPQRVHGLRFPTGLAFGPDGALYTANHRIGRPSAVLRTDMEPIVCGENVEGGPSVCVQGACPIALP